ncbi:hypothetical protein GE09DRAFT_424288 [Coniochaeta sp. 2T2.1]|nr:hypothetical protein GE09DRAFT_424288 [Coniochaeta sp. 2T2.1]
MLPRYPRKRRVYSWTWRLLSSLGTAPSAWSKYIYRPQTRSTSSTSSPSTREPSTPLLPCLGAKHIILDDPRRRYRLHQGPGDRLSASDREFFQIHLLSWQEEVAGCQRLDSVEEQHTYTQTVDLRNNSDALFGLSAFVSVRSKTCN